MAFPAKTTSPTGTNQNHNQSLRDNVANAPSPELIVRQENEIILWILGKALELVLNPLTYLVIPAISFLGAWVFNKVLPIFIKAKVTRDIELFKRELLRKEKVEIISKCVLLLKKQRNGNISDEEKEELDESFLELCLHLPPCLVHKLAHTACSTKSDEDLNPLGLFVEVRRFIDGEYKIDKKRKLTWENIPLTVRPEDIEKKRMYEYLAGLEELYGDKKA